MLASGPGFGIGLAAFEIIILLPVGILVGAVSGGYARFFSGILVGAGVITAHAVFIYLLISLVDGNVACELSYDYGSYGVCEPKVNMIGVLVFIWLVTALAALPVIAVITRRRVRRLRERDKRSMLAGQEAPDSGQPEHTTK